MALAGGAVRRMIFWIPPRRRWRKRDSGVAASTAGAGPGHWAGGLHWDHEVFQGAAAAKLLARGMMPISIMRPPHDAQRLSERPITVSATGNSPAVHSTSVRAAAAA